MHAQLSQEARYNLENVCPCKLMYIIGEQLVSLGLIMWMLSKFRFIFLL